MPTTVIAFIRSEKWASAVIDYAVRSKSESLTIFSDHDLSNLENSPKIKVKAEYFSNYRDKNLDQEVLYEIKNYVERILDKVRFNNLNINGINIKDTITYPFGTISQHWFRNVLTMKEIISKLKPDKIVVDNYWFRHSELLGLQQINRIEKFSLRKNPYAIQRKILFLWWIIVGITCNLILSMIIGKLFNIFQRKAISEKKVFLVGPHYHNKSFLPIWKRIERENTDTAELFFFSFSLALFKRVLSSNRREIIEGLVDVKDILCLIRQYFEIVFQYYLKNANSDKKALYFDLKFDRWLLLNFPKALLFREIGNKFVQSKNAKRILISLPNSWQSVVLSEIVKKQGIETVSFTHGMVLDPISYRSNTSLKITWGAFDSMLLSKYSDDQCYLPLKRSPHSLKKDSVQDMVKQAVISECISISYAMKGNGKKLQEELTGRCAGIFPSSNLNGHELQCFLKQSIGHLKKKKDKYLYDIIVVKIHPRSDLKEFRNCLEKIVQPKDDVNVCVSKNLNINFLLGHCIFALCTPSSIMLELLRFKVPFSIYMVNRMHDVEFISLLPPWMTFQSVDDLDRITGREIHEFTSTADSLINLYWGNDDNDEHEIDSIVQRLSA